MKNKFGFCSVCGEPIVSGRFVDGESIGKLGNVCDKCAGIRRDVSGYAWSEEKVRDGMILRHNDGWNDEAERLLEARDVDALIQKGHAERIYFVPEA